MLDIVGVYYATVSPTVTELVSQVIMNAEL